tara:strand:+ start:178 stop:339 length:162 start_codon:yes stop_codon:yes gene_type:complete
MNSRLKREDLDEIEKKLRPLTYDQIPKAFINVIDSEFSAFGYLKSLIEMKKTK